MTYIIISATLLIGALVIWFVRRHNSEAADDEYVAEFLQNNSPENQQEQPAPKKEELVEEALTFISENLQSTMDFLKESYLQENHYFAFSEMEKIKAEGKPLFGRMCFLKEKKCFDALRDAEMAEEFYTIYDNWENVRKKHNEEFVKKELTENKEFFDTVLSYPLDSQQRNSIVKLEDNCLVISSAGSGKTSTMIGKLLYLVQVRGIRPARILTITYTHKAAEELTGRLMGTGLSCMTFHKLAMMIVAKVEGKKPSIADNNLFLDVFNRQLSKPEFREAILNYMTDYKSQMLPEHSYANSVEYYADRKKYGITSLYSDMDGRLVSTKSEEERKLCSYLTELGVAYRYEKPYEYETMTEDFRQYRPDFTIYYTDEEGNEHRVYLEHFGIDANERVPRWFGNNQNGGWLRANEAYLEGIQWKKNLHAMHGTKLIYTTSAMFHKGTIRENLKFLLTEAGVPIVEQSPDSLLKRILSRSKSAENALVQLLQGFVNLVKANGKTVDDIYELAKEQNAVRDMFVIDKLMRPIWEDYKAELESRGEMDFTDVIVKATQYCNEGKWPNKYEFILIDEFQDISIDRYNFLLSLRTDLPKTKLYCVGDDWQSIYRFTGSDMSLFTEFSKYFGYTEECKIETTYRFYQPLISASSKFVESNPLQKKKRIHSRAYEGEGVSPMTKISFLSYNNDMKLGELLERMIARVPSDKSAYIISRYTYDVNALVSPNRKMQYNAEDDSIWIYFPTRRVKFMTIHGSKGLEADYVFLINCNAGLYGFPSLVSDDPVMDYVLSDPEHYEYAEERRVFYVGITRAKVHTVVLYNERTPSPFVCEMDEKVIENPNPCPLCRTGHKIIKYEGWTSTKPKSKYIVWGCDNRAANCQYFEREFFNGRNGIQKSRTFTESEIYNSGKRS